MKMIDEKRKEKHDQEEYEKLNKEIVNYTMRLNKFGLTRNAWRLGQILGRMHIPGMHQQISILTGRTAGNITGCLKSKVGGILMGQNYIVNRWT